MTTLTQDRFDFSFYTEQSGSFLVPDKCNGEILVIAAGGGGGGGAGNVSKGPSSPGFGNVPEASISGDDGGETSIIGSFGNLNFSGGQGGKGGGNMPSPTSNQMGGAGAPGLTNLGTRKSSLVVAYTGAVAPTAPVSTPAINVAIDTTQLTNSFLFSIGGKNPDPKNKFELRGADGASRTTSSNPPSPSSNTVVNTVITLAERKTAQGLNAGQDGFNNGQKGNTSSIVGRAGGAGAPSIGIKKKVKVNQGEVIDLEIGSGGNGGTTIGAPTGPAPGSHGSDGGAGASGFVYLFWNED